MKNLDRQIEHIESLLQQILRNTSSGTKQYHEDPINFDDSSDYSSSACPGNGHNNFPLDKSPVKGKTIIMISKGKKKNGAPLDSDEMPDILKEIMGSILGSK